MPHRRCRKTTAIFLCWVMTLFWCQGIVYPVNGELGIDTFDIVDIQVLDEASADTVIVDSEGDQSDAPITDIDDDSKVENTMVQHTTVQSVAPPLKDESDFQDTLSVTLQKGETLSGVAYKYQTTIAEIVKLNHIEQPDSVFAGQKIKIPVKGGASTLITSEPSRGRALVSQEELELLARVIHAEARGEDFAGQVAVGAVVLNRVEDHRFPNTIHEVVYQPGAFTAVIDKQIHLDPNQSAFRAAEAALNGEDPTDGAIYYYNPRTATDRWIKTRPVVKTIGNHTFSI